MARRSVSLTLPNSRDSSVKMSWSAGLTTVTGCNAFLIASFPDDTSVIRDHSPESLILQQPIQVDQRQDRYLRLAELQPCAGSPIQHPRGDGDCHTGLTFNHDHVSASTLLAVIPTNTAPIERVPAIVNFYFLPDMGRMTQ
jgi:hypothetical protein